MPVIRISSREIDDYIGDPTQRIDAHGDRAAEICRDRDSEDAGLEIGGWRDRGLLGKIGQQKFWRF